jgi:hypothetical protein
MPSAPMSKGASHVFRIQQINTVASRISWTLIGRSHYTAYSLALPDLGTRGARTCTVGKSLSHAKTTNQRPRNSHATRTPTERACTRPDPNPATLGSRNLLSPSAREQRTHKTTALTRSRTTAPKPPPRRRRDAHPHHVAHKLPIL